MTNFGTLVQGIVDRVATIVTPHVLAVSKGSQRFLPTIFPLALISVGRIASEPATLDGVMGKDLYLEIPIEIVVIIRETAPTDWLTEVILPLGEIVDAVNQDRTLSGNCDDSYLSYCEPARLTLSGESAGGKIYYGGLITFLVKAFYKQ